MTNHSSKTPPSVYPKGIFLLPSVMTGINIILGFYSMILVTSHNAPVLPDTVATRAAILIILAAVFDAFDGRIARMTKTTSPFGAQLDSIADVVSFGLAPSILVYHWALKYYVRFGWIAALLFLLAGAIRLARFNVLDSLKNFDAKRYFVGLPIPAAAISIALMVAMIPDITDRAILRFSVLITVYVLAFLMVSSFHFKSFKDIDWRRRRPIGTFFLVVIGVVVVLHEPFLVMSIMMSVYLISGVMMQIAPRRMRHLFTSSERWFNRMRVLDDDEKPTSTVVETMDGEAVEVDLESEEILHHEFIEGNDSDPH